MTFKKVDPKVSFPKLEEETLKYWEENKIFEKSVQKDSPAGDFVFYEGPPTANGKPGLHHVLARSFKDIIPRYKTMKGYRVERKAGWDTHGLPVELQVEKALGLKNKQDIENIVPGDARASVIEFNKKCKESVWEYRDLWEKLTRRMGYWVDMEHPYVTYENEYIESVWWQLAQIAELKNAKDESFLYRGHKVVPYCYRCGTALSSHEVAQGYQTVKDNSVYVKFKVPSGQSIIGDMNYDDNMDYGDNTYFLAWTTTPWTLPGNVALAINSSVAYGCIEHRDGNRYIFAYNKIKELFVEEDIIVTNWVRDGKILLENKIQYKPLYETAGKDVEKSYRVVDGSSFVTTDSGTGIVHIAPAFGEDDANVGKENGLPTVLTVETDGTLSKGFGLPGEGIQVKKKNDKNRYAVDDLIIEDLKQRGLFFKEEVYEHEYPFCWRCDTPLVYYAKPSWFIRMSELSDALVQNNEQVSWVPEHIKEGRFGEWLRGVKDWAISRERYWGTPLPIWECQFRQKSENSWEIGCGNREVISSVQELEEKSGKKPDDLHKPYIDDVTWQCSCGGIMRRTPEVLDVWFDSGAMPLAQFAYPAKSDVAAKEKIEAGKYFPADYICEAVDQTRGWFYTLHAVATLLNKAGRVPTGNAYKNVICLGHIMDAHGKKMSKSRGNVIDPFQMFDEFGADPLRWMLFSINQPGLPKRFDVKGMRDVQNRVFRMLWNSYSFFTTYASIDNWEVKKDSVVSGHILDRWIISSCNELIRYSGFLLDQYDVYSTTKEIEKFIDNLSNWYIRRSRDRFWKSDDDVDKEQAYQTLYTVLVTLSKLMAPFTPFLSEEIYRNLIGEESVHLADWPEADTKFIDTKLNKEMFLVRELVTTGLKMRSDAKIKVRQPLLEFSIGDIDLRQEMKEILKEELNVKNINIGQSLGLNTEITEDLRLEGEMNEINRAIQDGRKKAGFNVEDRITLGYIGKENVFKKFGDDIAKKVLATEVKNEDLADVDYRETVTIEGEEFSFSLKKI
jgi:isoleucyl-tRNA synthetase